MLNNFSFAPLLLILENFFDLVNGQASNQLAEETVLFLSSAGGNNSFFSIDPGIVLWVWIIFFITLGILYVFAWKPILKMLRQREHLINKSIINAKKIEKDLKSTKEKVDEMILAAQEKEKEILAFARKQADELKNSIEKKTRDDCNYMIFQAKETIATERKEAIKTLQQEVGRLSLKIAKKVLDAEISEEKNTQLVQKYLNEL